MRSQVEANNYGKIVAIDIETGAFEVGNDILSAAKQYTGCLTLPAIVTNLGLT